MGGESEDNDDNATKEDKHETAEGFVDVSLTTKRRRWGRFIGLKGCESPADEEVSAEALVERMEREWKRAREKAVEEREGWEKGWRGRW